MQGLRVCNIIWLGPFRLEEALPGGGGCGVGFCSLAVFVGLFDKGTQHSLWVVTVYI